MKQELIVKHNKIIEGKYNLDTWEIKIIAKLSSLIHKDDDDFKEFNFKSSDLLNELGFGEKNHIQLKETIEKLITKKITIQKEKETLVTTFLSSCRYMHDTSEIILRFDPNLRPYLLQLKENFTKYQLENVLSLSSFYAIRIYELCKQYETIKERTIEIKELKEILDIKAKSYNIYNNFKQKVLDIAEREINEKTDISIKFEELKTGRKVTAVKFLISTKKKQKNIENKKEIEVFEEKEYSGAVRGLFQLLPEKEQIETRKNELEKLLKEHSIEMLKADIEYTKNKAKTDFWAYFLKSIKSGHYSSAELEKKKIAEEKKKLRAELEEKEKIEMAKSEKIDENNLTEAEKKYLDRAKKIAKLVN